MSEVATPSNATEFNLTSVTAKLTAEMLIGRISFDRSNPGKSEFAEEFRPILIQFRKALGMETMEEFVKTSRPALHALVDAFFDAVTGIERNETAEAIKRLPMSQRTVVEILAARATGKMEGVTRWASPLWALKQRIGWICRVSLSGITEQEIRGGYHDLVHQVVDRLCDDWKTVAQ